MHNYGLYVPLTTDEFDRLRDLARAERRPLRDQAAVLLARALAFEQISVRTTDRTHSAPTSNQDDGQPAESGTLA